MVFCDKYDAEENLLALERILRERLGDDAVSLLHLVTDKEINGIADLEYELKSYEQSCENYRSCLQDVHDGLKELAAVLSKDRIDRRKMGLALEALLTKINNEL